eukprot:76297-Chlamydomonas_euryale.AAC.1
MVDAPPDLDACSEDPSCCDIAGDAARVRMRRWPRWRLRRTRMVANHGGGHATPAGSHPWVHISIQRSILAQHGPRAANRQGPWTQDRLSSNTIAKSISLLKWQPGCMPAAVSSGGAALGQGCTVRPVPPPSPYVHYGG